MDLSWAYIALYVPREPVTEPKPVIPIDGLRIQRRCPSTEILFLSLSSIQPWIMVHFSELFCQDVQAMLDFFEPSIPAEARDESMPEGAEGVCVSLLLT